MRRSLISIVRCFVVLVLTALCSCTQNDGDIGSLFGIWSLNGFSYDGIHASEELCEGHSIRFQSNVVQYVENLPHHDSRIFIGSWIIVEDSLILRFPDIIHRLRVHTDDPIYEDSPKVDFPIFPELGFKINTLSNSVLDISRTTSDGEELRYYFKKLN